MTSPLRHTYSLDNPPTKLLVGDCREIAPLMQAGCADVVFGDPPFNIAEPYSTWKDKLPGHEYREFTHQWLDCAVNLLSPRGTLWVNIPDDYVARVVVYLEDQHKLVRANWCVWHYRFGQWRNSGFVNSKVHVLRFVRDPEQAIWNTDGLLVESDRRSKYKDKRTDESRTPGLRVPLDTWGIPSDGPGWNYADAVADVWGLPADGDFWGRVQGNNKERAPQSPNQLPEVYLERVIRSTSLPGSLVVDMFAGSGTSLVVARALGRPCVGIEIGDAEAKSAFARIQRGSVRIAG